MKKNLIFAAFVLFATVVMAEDPRVLLLDSVVTSSALTGQNQDMDVYAYDGGTQPSLLTQYTFNAGSWVQSYQYMLEYVYNTDGTIATQNWKINSGGWTLMYRINFAYDEYHRPSYLIKQSLSATGNWSNVYRQSMVYAEDGTLLKIVEEFADGDTGWYDYYTYVFDLANSTSEETIADIYWTGYEDEGAESRIHYYYSEHTLASALESAAASKPSVKLLENGQVIIQSGNLKFSVSGVPVR